jgi:hypothetical protein
MGDYLNLNVSVARNCFEFAKDNELLLPFSQKEIEKEAAEKARKAFSGEVKLRQEKKKKRIREYVDERAPWHKTYLYGLDFALLPYDATDAELEFALQKLKFSIEQNAKAKINSILNGSNDKSSDITEELIKEITEIGKSDLVHYVASRKSVLSLFKKSLEINDEGDYEIEKVVHDIIFPTTKDSEDTPYENHNLWIIDERLSFHEYLQSDKSLKGKGTRPDILLFNKRILMRGENSSSNPIVVIEFKRPQRGEYTENDDPIQQIGDYVKRIRKGEFKTPAGRTLNVTENTPAFGYLICDLTKKIEEFCIGRSLTKSPDNKGYFGYHIGYNMYIEVISFDKLVEDAELRNKIFFKKLGLE